MTMLGHNNGPTMEKGAGWRRYAWKRARADLMPKLPLEVARRRVKRARELGIDYKSYAGIRAATGRDIVALIFSSNALRLAKETALIEAARAEKLEQIKHVDSLGLIQPPFDPADVHVKKPDPCRNRPRPRPHGQLARHSRSYFGTERHDPRRRYCRHRRHRT